MTAHSDRQAEFMSALTDDMTDEAFDEFTALGTDARYLTPAQLAAQHQAAARVAASRQAARDQAAAVRPTAAHVARAAQAATGDDLLTALAASCDRRALLVTQTTRVLKQALDLCGEDAQGLGRAALIDGILASF